MRILYLDLDTLRPDHLGCYGYHRDTSPNIDAIARRGVVFENVHCSDAPCLPSRAALMSGRFGIHTGVVGHGGTAGDRRLMGEKRGFRDQTSDPAHLPYIFRRAGMKTALVSPFAERHSAWWFYAGFTEMYNTGRNGHETAEEISTVALDWLNRHAEEDDWYLHVNFWDPHGPYRTPMDFGNPFEDEAPPDWLTPEILEYHRSLCGPHNSREIRMFDNKPFPEFPRYLAEMKDFSDWKKLSDGYDCGIRYMDEHIGRLLAVIDKAGVLDDTAVVVSSDHGENLGELGIYIEHATADRITTRIPMVISWPNARQGKRDTGLHYNLDLAPTYAELLEQEPQAIWDGGSFAQGVTTGEDCGRNELIVSQNAHVCQRGVRFGPWMYIRTWHDGFHLFPKEMLFNIAEDPHEQHDLAADNPTVVREAAAIYLAWHDEMMRTMPEGYTVDPMQTVLAEGGPLHARGHLRHYIEHLKKTGRGKYIEELKARHPQEFISSSFEPE